MKITLKQIKNKLTEVMDPELNISVVDLGLIYRIKTDKNRVRVVMTLTTAGCPLFPLIVQEIKDKIGELGVKKEDISLKLTFDPPWTMEKISKKGRKMLGI